MGSINSSNGHESSNSSINPKFLPYAMDALDRAEQVGNQGYTPFMGNDVAVPDALINSWQGAANRSAAFNTPGQAAPDIKSTLPLKTQNGVQGYSSYDGYQNQLAQLQQNYPALYDYIKSFAIDPVTGTPGSRTLDTATKIRNSGGHGNGKFNPSIQDLISQGFNSDGGFGAMMGFMGLPYYTRDGGAGPGHSTSAYKQLYDKKILTGGMQ